MTVKLYLSLSPEALIASMLEPAEFGQHLSVGSKYKTKGQAYFFDIDPDFRNPYFQIDEGIAQCVAHPDGTPKNSIYISVYRVLEHVPLSAIGRMYLTTDYGQVLSLERGNELPAANGGYHLYQDIAPVTSLVVSKLGPKDFYESVTIKPSRFVSFPSLAFVELGLGELAKDPEKGAVGDLPYSGIAHLRECLVELDVKNKDNKLVDRLHTAVFPYRMVQSGFYIGNGPDFAFYPMPSREELRDQNYHWWRMANL